MRLNTIKSCHGVFDLISRYEDMLERGQVVMPDEESYHRLIDYYEQQCLLERALEVIEYALLQYERVTDFYLRKAELLLEGEQAVQAMAVLNRMEQVVPVNLQAVLLRAECLAAMDLHEEGIDLLEQMKAGATPDSLSDIYVCEALIYESLKEHDRTFYLLKAALEENPANSEALSRMWFCVENARKHQESVLLHDKILDADPYNALAWYNLGAAHHYLCNYEKAIEAYEYAYLIKDDFEFAYRDCAEVCLYVQNYNKALQCYQEVFEKCEPDADLLLHIGICYYKLGNPVVAKSFFQKATDFDCYCADAHFYLGECHAVQAEWHKAISAYLKAIRIDDRNEEYYARLSEAYSRTGNYKKAELYLRQAADTGPEDPRHWVRLIAFLMKRGKTDEALDVLDEAEDYTYSPELLYCRSACLFDMGLKKDALLVLEEALNEDFEAHNELFRLVPVLENDTEVRAVIAVFQPESEE